MKGKSRTIRWFVLITSLLRTKEIFEVGKLIVKMVTISTTQ